MAWLFLASPFLRLLCEERPPSAASQILCLDYAPNPRPSAASQFLGLLFSHPTPIWCITVPSFIVVLPLSHLTVCSTFSRDEFL
ncbi:hypothetical protein TIFTF001_017119 [Ficus carica]|uniref:Secreted protein n=1 Tax=Ficus carica TaxID=3494 RepID=A0AA88A1K0_FICCA|nr:hypothetical protein TIFTF001_017119 [Ficus carica]